MSGRGECQQCGLWMINEHDDIIKIPGFCPLILVPGTRPCPALMVMQWNWPKATTPRVLDLPRCYTDQINYNSNRCVTNYFDDSFANLECFWLPPTMSLFPPVFFSSPAHDDYSPNTGMTIIVVVAIRWHDEREDEKQSSLGGNVED